MESRRFVIELGMGSDLHGQDVTRAAQKAVRDAISRSCLCGLTEILNLQDLNAMQVSVTVAAPYPERVNTQRVLEEIPFGKKNITVMQGGMEVPGMFAPQLGDSKDSIVVVNVAVVVSVDPRDLKNIMGSLI